MTSYRTLARVRKNEFVYPKLMAWEGARGTTLAVYNGLFYANALVSFNHSFTMPNFGVGTYYLYQTYPH